MHAAVARNAVDHPRRAGDADKTRRDRYLRVGPDGDRVLQVDAVARRLVVHVHPSHAPAVALPHLVAVAGWEHERLVLLRRGIEMLSAGRPADVAPPVAAETAVVQEECVMQHDALLWHRPALGVHQPGVHGGHVTASPWRGRNVEAPLGGVAADAHGSDAEGVGAGRGSGRRRSDHQADDCQRDCRTFDPHYWENLTGRGQAAQAAHRSTRTG